MNLTVHLCEGDGLGSGGWWLEVSDAYQIMPDEEGPLPWMFHFIWRGPGERWRMLFHEHGAYLMGENRGPMTNLEILVGALKARPPHDGDGWFHPLHHLNDAAERHPIEECHKLNGDIIEAALWDADTSGSRKPRQ